MAEQNMSQSRHYYDSRQRDKEYVQAIAALLKDDPGKKNTPLYQIFKKLDSLYNDELLPLCDRFAIPSTPVIQQTIAKLLADISTVCCFPELIDKPTYLLRVPYVADAFKGESLGLIEVIDSFSNYFSQIPILATYGPRLKLEYVNYRDLRQEISFPQLVKLLKGTGPKKRIKLNRIVKNFVLTAPEVKSDCNIAIVGSKYEQTTDKPEKKRRSLFERRLGSFICRTFTAPDSSRENVRTKCLCRNYLGFRETAAYIKTLACSNYIIIKKRAEELTRAFTKDLTRLNEDSCKAQDFFKECRKKEEERILEAERKLQDLNLVLIEIDNSIEILAQSTGDYPRGKYISLKSNAINSLFEMISLYTQEGRDNEITKLKKRFAELGHYPKGFFSSSQEAVREGKQRAFLFRPDPLMVFKKAEKVFSNMSSLHPRIIPRLNGDYMVDYKIAAALGSKDALRRIVEILYAAREKDYEQQQQLSGVKLSDAEQLLRLCYFFRPLDMDDALNRKRITNLRFCTGQRKKNTQSSSSDSVSYVFVGNNNGNNSSSINIDPASLNDLATRIAEAIQKDPLLGNNIKQSTNQPPQNQSQNQQGNVVYKVNYEPPERVVKTEQKSCCFVVTATTNALRFSPLTIARTFYLMIHLHDSFSVGEKKERELLGLYYKIAPILVRKIDRLSCARNIYQHLWENYIAPCCAAIKNGNILEGKRLYTDMMRFLLESIP